MKETTIGVFVVSRKYEKVNELLPIIRKKIAEGKTHQEIVKELGLSDKKVVRNLLYRERQKEIQGLPKFRGRKPAKTLQEYKYENKRLKMENELLRDFLSLSERM